MMQTLTIQAATATPGELPDMPIQSGWILEGAPQARGAILLQSADKLVSSGLWSCTAGRFKWEFAWDEFVHVLAGEATISEQGGETYTLRPGDSAHFPIGLKTEWTIRENVRKSFTIRTPEPLDL